MTRYLLLIAASLTFTLSTLKANNTDSTLIKLNNYSYVYGREYYVLRSGRTQMFIQSDKIDVGSAFVYLLFDAQNARQSVRKDSSWNFTLHSGFQSSALEVVIGNYAFVALGQNTTTHWIFEGGIPMVESKWWAGGILVTEKIFAIQGMNAFKRIITLSGRQIVGEEKVKLRLYVPEEEEGENKKDSSTLFYYSSRANFAVSAIASNEAKINLSGNCLEIPDIAISPGHEKTIETYITTQIPAGDKNELAARVNLIHNTKDLIVNTQQKWQNSSVIAAEDSVIQNLFDNVRFTLPGYVSDVGIMDAGVFEYGGQWIRDASNTALGLIHIGEFETARSLLSYMLDNMITMDGTTMISNSFEKPENEEFDQMGELWHALKNYYYWTGDASIIKQNASKLIAMTERPLIPLFRDSTGMVHNKREFWERFLDDAYELAYQIWVIQGLRDAAELAPIIGAESYIERWKSESDKMLNAMLHDPKMALVSDGKLIKRRNINGEIADILKYSGYIADSPGATEKIHRLLPDATMALPVAMHIIDPKSLLAKNTLAEIEKIWNCRWNFGGYDRYHTSSHPDQPGPWPFATCFILRAQHEAGLYNYSRRTLEWLYNVQGGHSGAYFEEIPINRGQEATSGILPWTAAEIGLFVVRHWLGVSIENNRIVIKPNFYPDSKNVRADLRFRQGRIKLEIKGSGQVKTAFVNGTQISPDINGSIRLPEDFTSGEVIIDCRL